MKTGFLFILLLLFISDGNFKSAQLNYPRVKEAYTEKEEALQKLYREKNIDYKKQAIFIRVFKHEKELEVWVKNKPSSYALLNTYSICNTSGGLGPKRKTGDYQVPEGFYHID